MGRRKISTVFSLICLLFTGILLVTNISIDDVVNHVIKTRFCLPQITGNDGGDDDNSNSNTSIPGCVLPHVNPYDPAILPYLTNKTLSCSQSPPLTAIDSNGDRLMFVKSNVTNDYVDCYYSWVYRDGSDSQVFYSPVNVISPIEGVKFKNDANVVNTSCINRRTSEIIYRNIHFRIPKFHHQQQRPSSSNSGFNESPSVLILVIESLSRLSFQRWLSSTNQALNKIGHFHHLKGLNRVEENSFPNSMALLSGMAITDNVASSFQGIRWDHRVPYIWDNFKNLGHVTSFLEDQPMAGLFSYYNRGFTKPPTDFYPVEFWTHMYPEGTKNMMDLLVNPVNYCFQRAGAKVDIFLSMCSKFVEDVTVAQKSPYFLYAFYSQMTHEDFNNFQLVDKPVAQFLQSLTASVLNNSIIMVVGDHGPRMGQITERSGDPTNTPMGRMEGSLPFFAIRIPDSLDSRYPHLRKYLSLNEDRLSTWFDIHQILIDTAQGQFKPIGLRKGKPVAYSLFREEIPISRTCADANISPVFCACNGKVGIFPRLKTFHIDAAKGLVDELRTMFQKNKCHSRITYGETLSGEVFYPRSNETWSTIERAKLTIGVRPSHAAITATVYRWRNSTDDRWSSWKFYNPSDKLKSPEYTSKLTKLLCVNYALKDVKVSID